MKAGNKTGGQERPGAGSGVKYYGSFGSAIRILFIVALSVFVCEALVMLLVPFRADVPVWVNALLDSTLLVVLLFPVFYFFLFRPLILHIRAVEDTGEELEKSHRILNAVFEGSTDAVFVKDRKGRYLMMNDAGARFAGKPLAGIIGKDDTALFSYGTARKIMEEDGRIMDSGESRMLEEVATAEGVTRTYLSMKVPYRDSRGEVIGLIGIARDITGRKRVEREREFRAAVLSTQQETSLDGILVIDDVGRMLSYNRRFVEMWGIPSDVVESRSHEKALLEMLKKLEDPERFLVRVKYLDEHTGEKSREEIKLADGRTFDRYSAPMLGAEGRNYGRVWYFRDITGRKRAEEDRERIMAELVQSQKMDAVGRLAGGIAHDFNNMMVAVRGLSSLGIKNVKKTDPLYAYFENIHKASERAVDLTGKLTAFSRKQPTEFGECSLNEVVGKLMEMLPPLIGEDVEITTELDPGLWTTLADSGNLTQVIMNLTLNARDAMEGGGSRITIKTENVTLDENSSKDSLEARPGRFVRLSVIDTGSGMDSATIEHIFEPFYTTKEFGKGTGLGLSVAYGILKSHKGWIEVKSSPGKGAAFELYLPVIDGKKQKKAETSPGPKDVPGGKGELVLVVEDEESVRTTTRIVLEQNGYRVVEAPNAKEAIELFERDMGIQLAVMDVVLPDLDGVELAARLIGLKPALKVIMMSGYIDERSRMQTIRQMGMRFMEKPYEVPEFLRTVKEAMETTGG
jgi:PAS domain S-box-containing protein